jgi:cyclopropane fatty-acyl-phospholipid synthase-like methyltransferase
MPCMEGTWLLFRCDSQKSLMLSFFAGIMTTSTKQGKEKSGGNSMVTTDPGDLVLDPTCGSGTTAYVAEQWGRRWITIDTSRVALAIARQRLMTARFENYKVKKPSGGTAENPSTGFSYKTVPHIGLSAYP